MLTMGVNMGYTLVEINEAEESLCLGVAETS